MGNDFFFLVLYGYSFYYNSYLEFCFSTFSVTYTIIYQYRLFLDTFDF